MAAGQGAKLLGLALFHTQQIGGTGHVDIEKGPAHQEVTGFGGDVLGELGETLGGDDTGKPALAAAAHEIGHGAKRELAGFVGDFAGHGGGEELGLVDDDEDGVPEIAIGIEHAA
ncbi:hypothetical protein FF80_01289 [Devosia sp. LC5]|nr:hypothetical protein FF80_01289 [Devosia sp. LC5]